MTTATNESFLLTCILKHPETQQSTVKIITWTLLKDYLTFKLKCPYNLLTPMSSKMFMYFFLQSKRN